MSVLSLSRWVSRLVSELECFYLSLLMSGLVVWLGGPRRTTNNKLADEVRPVGVAVETHTFNCRLN